MKIGRYAVVLLIPVLFVVVGCGGGKSSQFYRLSAAETPMSGDVLEPGAVVLLEVYVAEYLKRPQLMTAMDDFEYRLEEYHRWAEPVGRSIESSMRDNLKLRLDTPAVVLTPYLRPSEADYRTVIRIERLESDEIGHCVLEASWSFGRASDNVRDTARTAETRRFETDIEGEPKKDDFSPRVAAMSMLLGQLSDAIAETAKVYVQTH